MAPHSVFGAPEAIIRKPWEAISVRKFAKPAPFVPQAPLPCYELEELAIFLPEMCSWKTPRAVEQDLW